jgi:hypothetical protein
MRLNWRIFGSTLFLPSLSWVLGAGLQRAKTAKRLSSFRTDYRKDWMNDGSPHAAEHVREQDSITGTAYFLFSTTFPERQASYLGALPKANQASFQLP